MNALRTESLTKQYAQHTALSNVSLTVPEGCIYGLLGPNGAGKTTLLRLVNQIIQPDSGSIFLFDEKLERHHVSLIGYLPEERGLYKKITIQEQLEYLAQLKGVSKKQAKAYISEWFEKMNITDWLGKKVEDLSKGMAQKVQFISTVMHRPKLIILDEPFSGFDPVNAQLITEHILDLKKNGSTIIFSTHRMDTVESLCDYIALINLSKKVIEGQKNKIKEQYRSHTFWVEHRQPLHLPEGMQLLNTQTNDDGLQRSEIHSTQPIEPPQLLRQLTAQHNVWAFGEKLPTMQDIFIQLVKETSTPNDL